MKYCLAALPEIDPILRAAGRILIATDFDGTLCPIVDVPSQASVAPATLEILQQATDCNRLTLAVISGRALADVQRRLPLDITFAGNHGLEISGGGVEFENAEARQLRPVLADACEVLGDVVREWPAAWVEDKGLSATLHFRQVDQRRHNSLLFAARHALGAFGSQLALRAGNRALEIRPRVEWDKGSALQYILEKSGPFDTCISIGDDRTDETMFRANRGQLNIRVGCVSGSAATHYLSDSAEVALFLSHVIDVCNSEALPRRSRCVYTVSAPGGD
ncbi:MAG: trehalose-phosphatase [Bryobacteraceae bacterium]